ncbi:unnamed protein product [Calypogeia fissa]
MEIVPGAARVDKVFTGAKSLLEVIAQRLKAVFTNIKILLEGCIPAKDKIQFLSDKLDAVVNDYESADKYVRNEVATLVVLLCKCSDELLDADSIKDVMRVEVVNRILFSTLQEFTVPLDGLTHLEKLTQEHHLQREHLQREFSAYGYVGITLTRAGSLEIATTKLMDSGEIALQNACLLEPLLVDETITFWFWGHFRRLAICFYNLREYEGGIPWFEAALKVTKFESNQQVISNRELGLSFHHAAIRSADTEKRKIWFGRGVTSLQNFIALLDNANCPPTEASKISGAHLMIGEGAYLGLTDASLALQHFAKGAEIAATNSLHLLECKNALQYGVVIFETMRDKLEEIRASFRRSLEAVLKAIPCTDEVPIILAHIHRATVWVWEGILTHIQTLPSELGDHFLSHSPGPKLSSMDALWVVPTSWIVARARAHYILGCDYYYQRELDKAIDMVLSGLRILDAEPRIDEIGPSHSQILSAVMHSTLGKMYYSTAKFEEAVEHFHLCGQVHELKDKISKYHGIALFNCGDYLRALEVFKELSSQSLTDSDLCKQRAVLLGWKGLIEFVKGDIDECIVSLEAARKAYEEENTPDIQDLVAVHINLVQAYLKKHEYRAAFHLVKIFQPIVDQHYKGEALWQVWQAIKAVGHQMVGDLLSADKAMEQVKAPDRDDPVGDVTNLRSTELMALMTRSSVYRSQADIDSALEGYDQMEELIKDSEGEGLRFLGENFHIVSKKFTLPEIHLNRAAALLYALGNEPRLQRSCRESEQAALLLRKEEGQEVLLARALACQAEAMVHLSHLTGDHLGSKQEELIDEAIALVETRDSLLLAKFKHIKASILCPGNPSMAEAEGREAVLIFAGHQLQLRDMESAWVSMFGLEMKHLFNFMQELSFRHLGMPMKALLWAERGRTRLFVYIVRKQEDIDFSSAKHASDHDTPQSKLVDSLRHDLEYVQLQNNPGKVSCSKEERPGETDGEICDRCQQVSSSTSNRSHESVKDTYDNCGDTAESSGLDELWFDKDDALAEKYLFQAVEQCGPEALILEYTHIKLPKEYLFIYAVFMTAGDRHVVECEAVDVEALIERQREGKKKWIWGRTLATLISKTREYIVKKADAKATEGLGLLHSVLIEPVEKYVKAFQRLILCIHERLALVPFAALFNKQSGNFLVQEKTISYIPSIRVLHYCFHRQRIFERQMQKGLLDTPFVAGNPEPMGWRMKPLPGAAEEAKLVADMLGVRPCIGSDMTKEAVTAGLSKASMVLLATHGVVDTYFPHGALILQDCNSTREDERSSTSLARSTTIGLRGHFFQRLQDSPNGTVTGSAAIISDELASLPGGIRAGLVVLSTCKSGEGEVTSEGLLGLGRALLQGGAPAAILALWEVADSSNKVLIAGVFEQLVRHGKDVAEALRQAMLQMMESKEKKYHIFHWAPLVALGTPIFKYDQGPHSLGRSEA